MTDTNATPAPLTSGARAHYRIRVAGAISPDWSDRMGGLQITTSGRAGEPSASCLDGELLDQSALIGVLSTLYDLNLPIESVEHLSEPIPSTNSQS